MSQVMHNRQALNTAGVDAADALRRRRLTLGLLLVLALGVAAGLATGSGGFSLAALWADLQGPDAMLLIGQIRAPRTLGAALVGALLGLSGALAQGLFRNPLADPYLLGSASGASLGVVLVLAATAAGGAAISLATVAWIERVGLVTAAFVGALGGVSLTLLLARGAVHTLRLLLAGVVVGVMMGAVSDLVTVASPVSMAPNFSPFRANEFSPPYDAGPQPVQEAAGSFLGRPGPRLIGTLAAGSLNV
jgi:iron complex transport system permease protein